MPLPRRLLLRHPAATMMTTMTTMMTTMMMMTNDARIDEVSRVVLQQESAPAHFGLG
jgi:hypothetical protein